MVGTAGCAVQTSQRDVPTRRIVVVPKRCVTQNFLMSGKMLVTALSLIIPYCALSDAFAQEKPAFAFNNVDYFHRWSEKNQHEFTPAKQEDLKKWSEMMTVNFYRDVHDGDQLASIANAVLENYKNHKAMVLRTNSVPRTPERPAEHFIAVAFGQGDFIELAFARFKLVSGVGCSCVFSHRIYGEKVGDQASAWLKTNAAATEKALMEWNSIPSPETLK